MSTEPELRRRLREAEGRLYKIENQRPPSAPNLRDLSDAKVHKAKNGQVPTYNTTTGLWEPRTPAGVVLGCSVDRDDTVHGNQAIPSSTFTALTCPRITFTDGNWASDAYTVAEAGVYALTLRVRLEDNIAPTKSFGAGTHTSLVDGPWFLWADTSSATLQKRSSVQVSRITLFAAGDVIRPYIYVDSASVNVNNTGFDVVYQGAV